MGVSDKANLSDIYQRQTKYLLSSMLDDRDYNISIHYESLIPHVKLVIPYHTIFAYLM